MCATIPSAAAVVVSEALLVVEKKFAFGRYNPRMVNDRGLPSTGSMGYMADRSSQMRRICPFRVSMVDFESVVLEESVSSAEERYDWDCF